MLEFTDINKSLPNGQNMGGPRRFITAFMPMY